MMKSARVVFFLLVVLLLVFAIGSCSDLFGSKDDDGGDSSPGSLTVDGTVYSLDDLFVVNNFAEDGLYNRSLYLASSGVTFDTTPAGAAAADAIGVVISGSGVLFNIVLEDEVASLTEGTYADSNVWDASSGAGDLAGMFWGEGIYEPTTISDTSGPSSSGIYWDVSGANSVTLSRDDNSYTLSEVWDGFQIDYAGDTTAAEEVTLELDWTGPITQTYGTNIF